MPRLGKDGQLERKPASYADAMVATAGFLGCCRSRATGRSDRSRANGAVPGRRLASLNRSPTSARWSRTRSWRMSRTGRRPRRRESSADRLDEREVAADLVQVVQDTGRAHSGPPPETLG